MDLARYSTQGFDRGAPRWKEGAWFLVRALFFLTPLPVPSAMRAWWLRLFGARIGAGFVIRSQVNISFPWRFTAGDHVWLGEEVMILSLAPVTVESNVCVSQRAFLCTGSHDFRRATFDLQTKPITIRAGAWIAAQAFIGPGVEIGSGTVVSAGSVVMRNIAPHAFVRGNPGTVEKLLDPPA